MKHILNNLSEEEKKNILNQHFGSKKVNTKKFNKLVKSKLGDSKPLVEQEYDMDELDSEQLREKFESLILRFEETADELKEIFNEIHELNIQLDGIENEELDYDITYGLRYIDKTMEELRDMVYQ